MTEMQYISCVRFSLQLMIAESVFVLNWHRRNKFVIRILVSLIIYTISLIPLFTILAEIPGRNPYTYTLLYLCMFSMTLLIMAACFQVKMKEILYAGICGYATQHIAFAGYSIFIQLTKIQLSAVLDFFLLRVLPYIIIAFFVYFVFVRRNEKKMELKDRDIRMLWLALVILFAVTFLSVMVDSSRWSDDNDFMRNILCKIYAILCSSLAIFVGFSMNKENRALHEKEMMEKMLHNLKEQQKLSRENINIINIKCHDLKYRISKISRIESKDVQKEYIEEVKNAIDFYDNIFQTGNDALDLVLMEKSLLCDEYHIKFTSMADGELLQFIDSTDVYALFGNILDNAVESVMKADEEKRIISLKIVKRQQGVHIHADNYCGESLVFENGLPLTTKQDKAFHGFGVKSIQFIVNKYQGNLLMQQNADRFQLDIIF